MKARCGNTTHPAFKYYGGRGILVCDRWKESYRAFVEDMGEAPEGLWIDRIDNEKGYEPGNCRWVTPKKSAKNRKKGGPPVKPESLMQRAKATGIPYIRVIQRIHAGWPVEKALNIPVQPSGGMMHSTKVKFGLLEG